MGIVGHSGQSQNPVATVWLFSLAALNASRPAADPQPMEAACGVRENYRWKDDTDDVTLYVQEIGGRFLPAGPSLDVAALVAVLIYMCLRRRPAS